MKQQYKTVIKKVSPYFFLLQPWRKNRGTFTRSLTSDMRIFVKFY